MFVESVRNNASALNALEDIAIEDKSLDIDAVTEGLWGLIETIGIVDNKAKIVAGTKTLHHLLPDLVPPFDRQWTGRFFTWNPIDYQNRQRQIFAEGFQNFARIAQATQPSQYVGDGWRTSPTKLLDNAIIGYQIGLTTHTKDVAMPDVGRMTTAHLEELQELVANELKARQVPPD